MSEPQKVRVMLVDDHEVVRLGLQRMLSCSAEVEVVGTASSGEEAVDLVGVLRPDVVLLDLRLPGMHGLEVLSRLRESGPHPKVLVLTVHDDTDIVVQAVRGGAQGYVLKDASQEELLGAIRRVGSGNTYFDSVVVRALLQSDDRSNENALSEREVEVLRLLASGFTNKEIAEQLFLSPDTVKTHLSHAYRKLGVSDRAHAVAVALRKGLFE
jgi:DNA-binding NarL/FixJ family response regulator